MKQILDLRPVYHRLEERIRAHVVLCWLALLLIRIVETTTGATWRHIRRDLDRLHAVTFTGPTGTFRQRADPTKPQPTSTPSSASQSRRRSSRSHPHSADQAQHPRLVTHVRRVPTRIPAGQHQNPRTRHSPQLRNAGTSWTRKRALTCGCGR